MRSARRGTLLPRPAYAAYRQNRQEAPSLRGSHSPTVAMHKIGASRHRRSRRRRRSHRTLKSRCPRTGSTFCHNRSARTAHAHAAATRQRDARTAGSLDS
jgi:hypothetical protein